MAKPRATAAQHLQVTASELGSQCGPDCEDDRLYGYLLVRIEVGDRGTRRVVPPAGEDFAFDVHEWARTVELSVSPTGRAVRVFVDGKEIPPCLS